MSDLDFDSRAPQAGGDAALARFGAALSFDDKGSGADPVSDADREAEAAAATPAVAAELLTALGAR